MIITVDGVESGPAMRVVTELTLVVSYQVFLFVSNMCPEELLLTPRPRGGCSWGFIRVSIDIRLFRETQKHSFEVPESAHLSYRQSSTTNRETPGLMDGHFFQSNREFPAFLSSPEVYQSKIPVIVIEEVLKASRKAEDR